jgi:single-strand DNA-binding protein
MNSVNIIGNLTNDPDLKYTKEGTAVCDLSVAINDGFGDKAETCFIVCTVWKITAENCDKYLSKGSKVAIEGKLHQDRWEDSEGKKHSRIKITAFRVEFLNTRKPDENPNSPAGDNQDDDDDLPF